MSPHRTFLFQATGPNFRPAQVGLDFAQQFDSGSVATFGGSRGQVVPFGGALYPVPTSPSASSRDSELRVALVHLNQLISAFRAAGASEFALHIDRRFQGQCNEEFTRAELQMLASLGCHVFYVARNG